MPRKKKALALPPVGGASPPWSAQSGGSAKGCKGKDDRRVSWDGYLNEGDDGGTGPPSQSEPSTAVPLDMSRDDARGISQLLDDTLQLASGHSAAPDTVHAGDKWDVQSPEDIINEVTQHVHARKPWRPKLDDSYLENKHNERLDRLERGFHIILPDNRVRVMEDELSFRVRCSLLDIDPEDAPPPPQARRPEKDDSHKRRMRQNPWYLKPHSWYSAKDNESTAERSNDFPYANAILNVPGEPKPELTTFQKENIGIVEPYKAWMKDGRHRLPHFLQ